MSASSFEAEPTLEEAIKRVRDELASDTNVSDERIREELSGLGIHGDVLEPARVIELVAYDLGRSTDDPIENEAVEIADLTYEDKSVEQGVTVRGKVIDTRPGSGGDVSQFLTLADDTGEIQSVVFDPKSRPSRTFDRGEEYRFENARITYYEKGQCWNLLINENTYVEEVDPSIDVTEADPEIELTGTIINFTDQTGMVYRCPVEGCLRFVNDGACDEHGNVECEPALRGGLRIDTGREVFKAVLTNGFLKREFEGAQTALEHAREGEYTKTSFNIRIRSEFLGEYVRLRGRNYKGAVIVDQPSSLKRIRDPATICDPDRIAGRISKQDSKTFLNDVLGSPELPSIAEQVQQTKYVPKKAHRVFAQELNDARYQVRQKDWDGPEDKTPLVTLFPTGFAGNRALVVGVLTGISEQDGVLQATIDDGTSRSGTDGTYFVYASRKEWEQQPRKKLETLTPPQPVALKAKIQVYKDTEGNVNVCLRPEWVNAACEDQLEVWQRDAALQTYNRACRFHNPTDSHQSVIAKTKKVYGDDIQPYLTAALEVLEDWHCL